MNSNQVQQGGSGGYGGEVSGQLGGGGGSQLNAQGGAGASNDFNKFPFSDYVNTAGNKHIIKIQNNVSFYAIFTFVVNKVNSFD